MYYIYTENQLFLVMLKFDLIVTLIHHVQLFHFFPISDKFSFWSENETWLRLNVQNRKLFSGQRSRGLKISSEMLCLYASSPTAVSGQESYWQDDWHTDCPISTLYVGPMSRTCGRKRKSQSADWASSLSFNLSIWFMATHSCRGTSIEAEHFAGDLETPGSLPSPDAVFWNKIFLFSNLVLQAPQTFSM